LIPGPDDANATRSVSHQRKIAFSTEPEVVIFDEDDESKLLHKKSSSAELQPGQGLIRVYAGIWDLEVTYKCSLYSTTLCLRCKLNST